MILAVLSFLLRPLNAVSSVLLKTHSLFLTSEVHLPVLLHVRHMCQRKTILLVLFSDPYLIYPIFSFDLSYVVSMHQDQLSESDSPNSQSYWDW